VRNIFLSVVVICALVIAGIGGTMATLTDTEESLDNYIEVGSLDLKVNDKDDLNREWNPNGGIGAVIQQACIIPGTPMGSHVKVENEGCLDGYLYVAFKNTDCYNVEKPNAEGWFPDAYYDPPELKPEPEMVSEFGGMLAQKQVPGIGRTADDCSMNSHTFVTGVMSEYLLMPVGGGSVFIDDINIGALVNDVRYVGVLPQCGGEWWLHFYFDVPQESEGDHGYTDTKSIFNDASPFDDWPANALMADGITFDILFILVDHQLTADEIAAIESDL
jgi:predicted ribosomally synthesized peptide with SipW-like signal peptide